MKLKNRNAFIPNGFKFIQPETGWSAPKWLSFDATVKAIIAHRKGNPHLIKKHNWSTDYNAVASELDEYNALICVNAGHMDYIMQGDTISPKFQPPRLQPREKPTAAVAGNFKRIAAGVGILYDWLGSGGRPVAQEQAEARAAICATCPENAGGGITDLFTEPVAAKIQRQLEIKHEMQLATSQDDKLTVCRACLCPLHLKVWTPTEHVLKHTDEATKKRLDPRCWVLKEG